MPPAGFEPTTPTSKRPQTHALDRAATGIGKNILTPLQYSVLIIVEITVIVKYLPTSVNYLIGSPFEASRR
jgi:hypothetical protein